MRVSFLSLDTIVSGTWDAAKGYLREELQRLQNTINTAWTIEHNPDGSHGSINASGDVIAAGMGSFRDQPRCFVKITANQTIPNNTETLVSWSAPATFGDGSDFSSTPDGGWNRTTPAIWNSAEPTRFRVSVDGLYLLNYAIRFDANATGVRYAYITTSGHTNGPSDLMQCRHGAHAQGNQLTETLILPMRVGENFQVKVFQDSGGNLDLINGFLNTWFQVTKIG